MKLFSVTASLSIAFIFVCFAPGITSSSTSVNLFDLMLDFNIDGCIVFKNGRRFIIQDIVEMEQEINPQTLYWFSNNPNTDYVLSLIEIENVEGLQW